MPRVFFYIFLRPHGQGQHYCALAMWHWLVFHLFIFHVFLKKKILSCILVSFPIPFFIFIFLHFVVLGGSVIACRSIQRHIVAFESDIDIYKSILLRMHQLEQEHTSQEVASQRRLVFAPPPRKMAKHNFDLLCT